MYEPILIALNFFLLFFIIKKNKSNYYIISPALIYYFIWTLALSFYYLKIIPFGDIDKSTFFLISSASIIYFLGYLLSIIFIKVKRVNKNKINNNIYLEIEAYKKIIGFGGIISTAISFFGLIMFLSKIGAIFALDFAVKYLNVVDDIILNTRIGIAGYLIYFVVPAFIFNYISFLALNRNKFILLLIVNLITVAANTRRSLFFFSLILLFILNYYLIKNLKSFKKEIKYKSIIITILMALMVLIYFSFIQISLYKSFVNIQKDNSLKYALYDMIAYLSGNIAVIPYYIEMNYNSGVFLGYTFYSIYAILNNIFPESIKMPYFMNEFVNVPIKLNTVPYFIYWYFDLGYLYMFIMILFVGFISEWSYKKFIHSPNFFNAIVLSYLCIFSFLSIRENIFMNSIFFWFSLFLILLFWKIKNNLWVYKRMFAI